MAVRMELAPGGKINAAAICKPGSAISIVADKIGAAATINTIFAIIKNFCSRVNVARNLSEFQMIDAAEVLFSDAPKNYTLEDYLVAFDLAAKGLIKVNNGRGLIDRIDLAIINEILTEYDVMRYEAAEEQQEKEYRDQEARFSGEGLKQLVNDSGESWDELIKGFQADYREGRTGYNFSKEEQQKSRQKRIDEKKRFFLNGLPIHITDDENKKTRCGLNVDKTMSYHRGNINISLIKNMDDVCPKCLNYK